MTVFVNIHVAKTVTPKIIPDQLRVHRSIYILKEKQVK